MRSRGSSRSLFAISVVFLALWISPAPASGVFNGPMGPWEDQDIGNTGAVGSAAYTNGTFVLQGAGEDHWTGTADASHFMYRSWTGDCAFTIRVKEFTNDNSGPKAGIMFRATLDPGSQNAFVVLRPGGETGFQYRQTNGGQSSGQQGIYANAPYWLKLVRSQNTFLSYDSVNGVDWRFIGLVEMILPETIYVGLAVNSNQSGSLRTAVFDNLAISSAVPQPPGGLIARGKLNSVSVSWIDNSTNEQGFVVEWSYTGTSVFPYSQFVGANVTNFSVETWLYPTAISFRVKARGVNDSAYSEIATGVAGVIGPLPAPWQSTDIGNVRETGSGDFLDGIFRVSASGIDIGGVADQFHYAYQPLDGDGEIVAFFPDSVAYIGPGPSSLMMKAGLMFRQSLAPDSANAFVFLSPGSGAGSQVRTNSGASTISIPTSEWKSQGIWLRLTRSNNLFTAYVAGPELDWTSVASYAIAMTNPVFLGLAVTSHAESTLQSSAFLNVRAVPAGGKLSIARQSDGTNEIAVAGMLGRIYGIDASTNLVDWTRLVTQTNTAGTLFVSDGDAQDFRQRYYRSVWAQ